MRSSSGCWTCRLRRKKCDERAPVCDICAALTITCYYSPSKPEWMDGGGRQQEMAARLKREVKEKAHRRLGNPASGSSDNHVSADEASAFGLNTEHQQQPRVQNRLMLDLTEAVIDECQYTDATDSSSGASPLRSHRGADSTSSTQDCAETVVIGHTDSVLTMFFLENLFPFLFPYYRPSPIEGGKAWLLELMMSSRTVRQAALCHSSYFFSIARGNTDYNTIWEQVLKQSRDAFEVLRKALRAVDSSHTTEGPHSAVHLMTSIMHLQRFDIAISSFSNCRAHLDAALALFQQLLGNYGTMTRTDLAFKGVMSRLGMTPSAGVSKCTLIPSAEQAAFQFSSAILILDDILASVALQKPPRLYDYHQSLLGDDCDNRALIDLEIVMGCNNKALIQIGEISALNAWKQRCNRAGNLDMVELVRRALPMEKLLTDYLKLLESNPKSDSDQRNGFVELFTQPVHHPPLAQNSVITQIWTHAALLYLFVVVSGWQPFSSNVRYHVHRIVELLRDEILPPDLLRTLAWPFCVAGCIAGPAEQVHFRTMAQSLRPSSVFGTVHKALEIMENVWDSRNAGNGMNYDFAMCFRSQDDLVLLV